MKIGVFTPLFFHLSVDEVLDLLVELGVRMVEISTGNYPGNPHCAIDEMLDDKKKIREYKKKFADRGIRISGLSCHGNPLHPDADFAKSNHITWRKTVQLAEKLDIDVVNCLSGCPGDPASSKYPNWVTCPWPADFLELLEWQWSEKVIPYWSEETKFAKGHGIDKIALEMHPGMVVYRFASSGPQSSTFTQRTPTSIPSFAPATGCSTRSITGRWRSARGTSARSATVTATARGRQSSAPCERSVTTTCSASSTKTSWPRRMKA